MRRVPPKKRKNTKKINPKKVMLLIFLVVIVCLMIHPIQLFKNNIFKPMSVAAGSNNQKPSRYSQGEIIKNTYVDASNREYSIEFKQNLAQEVLLSYEDILLHKAEVVTNDGNLQSGEQKDLFLAEMKSVPNLNYELRYRTQYPWKTTLTDDVYSIAKEDATITQTESTRLAPLWNVLELGKYVQIDGYKEKILTNNQSLFDVGEVYATTRTLALYKRSSKILTVDNGGITAAEAYIMASNRNQSGTIDTDKSQQALWMINDQVADIEEIPSVYKGMNPEANIIGSNVSEEAQALKQHMKSIEEFKNKHIVDNIETEIYDNMLNVYDKTKKTNYYENGMAGLVAYDEANKEYLVGPFSIDYVRTVYVPKVGGQNENQNDEGTIIFNSIIDAEVYGVNAEGKEVKLNDWEFVYTDVEYNLKTEKATRIAETNAIKNGDSTPNIYPYPNENFYIKFKDPNIEAITSFEYRTSSMNADAEVYLYEGQYYNVSWEGATSNGQSYLQMTPSWTEIKNKNIKGIEAADLYQVKSARIVLEEKTIKLSVGNYHEIYKEDLETKNVREIYNGYCIPITMELAGTVWYDGTEVEAVKSNKIFGIRDKNEKGEYIEYGMENIYVHLYDNMGKKIASTVTDKNGHYIFKYVKLGPKYYIEFEYDGMKYKATTYLNGEDSNDNYKDSSQFLNYLDYSHAKELEQERTDYNNSFTEIKNGTTRTSGQKVSNNGVIQNISYITSENTKNYIGGIADLDRYNFSTRTRTTDLLYPLQNSYVITNKNISEVDQNQKYLKDLGVQNIFVLGRINLAKNKNYVVKTKQGEANKEIEIEKNFLTEETINYTMVDEYLHNINLGLVERAPIDFAVKNDLVQTILTSNNDIIDNDVKTYGGRLFDIDNFDIVSRSNTQDYKYFEDKYEKTIEYHEYTRRYDFNKNTSSMENDQAQLYVQYKMTVRNLSEVTSGYVTELVNYYEDDLYYPVDTNETWRYYDKETNYVTQSEWEKNGKKGYGNIIIPQVTTMTSWAVKNPANGVKEELGQVIWKSDSKFGESNNKDFSNEGLRTMYTNSFENIRLQPGESIDIYVIYKVEVEENSTVENGYGKYISNDNAGLGKRNILEINSYKSLNIDGSNGGRVDKDSAPGNIELGNYITYEDDVDAAPYLRVLVGLKTIGKNIRGTVWEDNANKLLEENNQKEGNGTIDIDMFTGKSTENLINNVMVELIRLEYNQTTGEYEEVEFTEQYKKAYPEKYTDVYPNTTEALAKNTNRVLSWTGPNHRNESTPVPLNDGEYMFYNLVSGGKYKVRFTYGTNDQLRTEIKEVNAQNLENVESIPVYTGHDFKATPYNGRIDVASVVPSTEVTFVVDSFEIAQKATEDKNNPIINVLKNINSNLKNANSNIETNIVSYGTQSYRELRNFDAITELDPSDTAYSGVEAIYTAGANLANGSATNKIMIIYNDGTDSSFGDVKEQISRVLDNGITVIGIGYGTESLSIYRAPGKYKDVQVYNLNEDTENHNYIQTSISEKIINQIIEQHYFNMDVSHAEDYLQDSSYYTMEGNARTVDGRLEVMKYSQETDPFIADSLNIEYIIKTLTPDLNENSEWSKLIKDLADKTQMTADSYEVTFYSDVNEQKVLNLGLQEIPERNVEVTNQVDNIVVKLASGRKIIDLNAGATQNVQEIPDKLFSIYMDEEIMQGATVEVTYRINVSNIGEVDNLYSYVYYATAEEKRNWYNTLTGNNVSTDANIDAILMRTEPIKISKLYSYFDNLVFRAEDNNKWEVVNKTVEQTDDTYRVIRDENENLKYLNEDTLYDSRNNIRGDRVVWTEVKDLSVLDRNKERIEKYSVVETTSLKDIELYPNKSMEVIGDLNNTTASRNISTVCTYLVLSKTLSPEDINAKDALNYRNYIEIVGTSSNTGRRDYNGAEGNFTGDGFTDEEQLVAENDTDNAERIIILPPFGDTKIKIGLIVTALVILGVGIIFIKRKVM